MRRSPRVYYNEIEPYAAVAVNRPPMVEFTLRDGVVVRCPAELVRAEPRP